ncbi:MAG: O-succinylbenzoic acid--CoA ligase [Lachnoclostridium sp.]|jgi:hypothetical protein
MAKKNKLKLISVKSFVTIVLTGLFVYLSVKDKITGDQFLIIFSTIITFYFGTQAERKKEGK